MLVQQISAWHDFGDRLLLLFLISSHLQMDVRITRITGGAELTWLKPKYSLHKKQKSLLSCEFFSQFLQWFTQSYSIKAFVISDLRNGITYSKLLFVLLSTYWDIQTSRSVCRTEQYQMYSGAYKAWGQWGSKSTEGRNQALWKGTVS